MAEKVPPQDVNDFWAEMMRIHKHDPHAAGKAAAREAIRWLRRARDARGLPEWKPGDEVWPPIKSDDETLKF